MKMQGDELKRLRKEMNLRQTALAQALGMTPQYVGQMERGVATIEPRTAMAVRYIHEHPEARPEVEVEDIKAYSIDELITDAENHARLFDGREWGPWRFDAKALTLDLDSRPVAGSDGEATSKRTERYYVRLTEVQSAKGAIQWIGHLSGKPWGPATLGYFVQALDDIFDLQGRFVRGNDFAGEDEVAAYITGRCTPADSAIEGNQT